MLPTVTEVNKKTALRLKKSDCDISGGHGPGSAFSLTAHITSVTRSE